MVNIEPKVEVFLVLFNDGSSKYVETISFSHIEQEFGTNSIKSMHKLERYVVH